jgi:uncharacterized protein YbjT (DUF2867 family)
VNYLITGATGFVGQALMAVVIGKGYRVIPVVRRSAGPLNETVVPGIDAGTGGIASLRAATRPFTWLRVRML